MVPNYFVGAGFESFWLGPRLERLWSVFHWKPNEAHNGYFEVLLNLGAIGLLLLLILLITGYRNAMTWYRRDPEAGRLRLAFILVGVIYSFTEAGFRLMSPVWIFFLLATMAVPERVYSERRKAKPAVGGERTPEAIISAASAT